MTLVPPYDRQDRVQVVAIDSDHRNRFNYDDFDDFGTKMGKNLNSKHYIFAVCIHKLYIVVSFDKIKI